VDLEYLRYKLRTCSLPQVFAYYLYQGANRVLPINIVRAFCLTTDRPGPPLSLQGNERCQRLSADEVRREAAKANSWITPHDAEANLALGDECFGVFVDGVVASHAWYSSRASALRSGIRVRFDPRYTYSRWAYTRPDYRGRALHALGKRHALQHYAGLGQLGILSVVGVTNRESLHSADRQGGRPVGLLVAVSLGDRDLLWASAGCRAYGLALESVPSAEAGAVTDPVRIAPEE
jgi:hypothetical protein